MVSFDIEGIVYSVASSCIRPSDNTAAIYLRADSAIAFIQRYYGIMVSSLLLSSLLARSSTMSLHRHSFQSLAHPLYAITSFPPSRVPFLQSAHTTMSLHKRMVTAHHSKESLSHQSPSLSLRPSLSPNKLTYSDFRASKGSHSALISNLTNYPSIASSA